MAAYNEYVKDWSSTVGSNWPSGSDAVGPNLDDGIRYIRAGVRYELATRSSVASASTTDLTAIDAGAITVSGTATITSFGVPSAAQIGMRKHLTFSGACTLTHSSTLDCITSANITAAAGDTALMEAISGGWTMLAYARKTGQAVASTTLFQDGTVGAPGVAFSADTDTGIYRVGANSLGFSAGGAQIAAISSTAVTLSKATSISSAGGGSHTFGDGASIATIAGNNITLTGGSSSSGSAGASVIITAGSQTSGGAGNVRGDVNIVSGSQTFASGSTGDRGGDVNITSGNVNDPSALAIAGTIRCKLGSASGGSTPGTFRVENASATALLVVSANRGTVAVGGSAPTITSGAGTGASISGRANAFRIVFGTSPSTTVVVALPSPTTGSGAFANAPIAVANYETSHIATRCTATTSQITIDLASTPAAGGVLHVIVIGYE